MPDAGFAGSVRSIAAMTRSLEYPPRCALRNARFGAAGRAHAGGAGASVDNPPQAWRHGGRQLAGPWIGSGPLESAQSFVVVGGGTMGRDIAAIFRAAGWRVQVVEPDAAARASLAQRVRDAAQAIGTPRGPGAVAVREALDAVDWSGVGLVIEAVPEKLPLKREVFAALERLAPAAPKRSSRSAQRGG
jgi:hypothetical protein